MSTLKVTMRNDIFHSLHFYINIHIIYISYKPTSTIKQFLLGSLRVYNDSKQQSTFNFSHKIMDETKVDDICQ